MIQSIHDHPTSKLQVRITIMSQTLDSYAHSMSSVVTNMYTYPRMSFLLYLICQPSPSDCELA